MKTELTLLEAFTLLAIDQSRKGRLHSNVYQYTLGGLIAAELYLMGRYQISGGLIKSAELIDDSDTGNTVLNEAIRISKQERGVHSVGRLIQAFGSHRPCYSGGADALVARGVLKARPIKIFWFFPATSYAITDTALLGGLKAEIEQLIKIDTGPVDPKPGVLFLFISQSGLLPGLLDRDVLQANKKRIKALRKGQAFADQDMAKDLLNIRGAMNRVATKDSGGGGGGE